VRGGPGDDRLYGGNSGDYLFAGPGDDQLYGGNESDRLFAGPGNDLVDGGTGGDTINGGGGRDELRAGELANDFQTDAIADGDGDESADDDRIVGHPGRTVVIYRARRRPLMIDLAAGTAGAKGERDELTGITSVIAGRGADHVVGSAAGEFIVGERGADEIRAFGGDDRLRGEGGADRLYGGRGDDIADDLDTDDAVDIHSCGAGSDVVGLTDKRDRLRHSCEDGAWSSQPNTGDFSRITAHPTIRGRRAIFESTCREDPRCKGRIRLVAADTRELLGTGSFRFKRYRGNDPDAAPRHDIVAELTDLGVERLERGTRVRVVIVSRWDCMGCLNPPPPARTGFTTRMKR
jgi:Ca2+-binding RTX toxin-like protein